MGLSERFDLPRDAFGRTMLSLAVHPDFWEDLVSVALWLEARGL